MLFWICIFVMVVGYLWDKKDPYNNLATSVLGVGISLSIISLVVICVSNIGWEGRLAKYQATYDSLTYQTENKTYEDYVVFKQELIDTVQDWNELVSWCQSNQDDFWIGIYIPNIFDNLEIIPLETTK